MRHQSEQNVCLFMDVLFQIMTSWKPVWLQSSRNSRNHVLTTSPLPPAVPWVPGRPLSPFSPGSPGGPIRPIRPGWPWSTQTRRANKQNLRQKYRNKEPETVLGLFIDKKLFSHGTTFNLSPFISQRNGVPVSKLDKYENCQGHTTSAVLALPTNN